MMMSPGDSNGVLLLLNYQDSQKQQIKEQLQRLRLDLLNALAPFGYEDILVCIGNEIGDLSNLSDSIYNAQRVIAMKYNTSQKILSYADFANLSIPIAQVAGLEINALLSAIREQNYSIIANIYTNILTKLHKHPSYSPLLVYDFIAYLFTEIENIKRQEHAEISKDVQAQIASWYHIFLSCSTEDQFTGEILELIQRITRKFAEANVVDSLPAVRHAKEYIAQHYMDEDLSLNTLSEKVGLSASYFSTVFKNETGMNFSDFITSVRITQAKKLLTETNLSVAIIAESIGYRDQKYFSKLFKKVTNLKPSDYRKLYS